MTDQPVGECYSIFRIFGAANRRWSMGLRRLRPYCLVSSRRRVSATRAMVQPARDAANAIRDDRVRPDQHTQVEALFEAASEAVNALFCALGMRVILAAVLCRWREVAAVFGRRTPRARAPATLPGDQW